MMIHKALRQLRLGAKNPAQARRILMSEAKMRLGERRGLLALLPEMTFFHRYRETFAS